MLALRRSPASADRFPEDVLELQGYLTGETRVPGVNATPGKGTNVPLYILGSSMFGATLAAAIGLPYAFASHFAPGRVAARSRGIPERVSSVGAARSALRHRRRQRRSQPTRAPRLNGSSSPPNGAGRP